MNMWHSWDNHQHSLQLDTRIIYFLLRHTLEEDNNRRVHGEGNIRNETR